MPSENRDSEQSADRQRDDEPIDLHAPPDEDREASKWGGYVLAALLLVVFLVGFLRVIDPAGTGLLLGAIGTLFGLAIVVLAFRERMG